MPQLWKVGGRNKTMFFGWIKGIRACFEAFWFVCACVCVYVCVCVCVLQHTLLFAISVIWEGRMIFVCVCVCFVQHTLLFAISVIWEGRMIFLCVCVCVLEERECIYVSYVAIPCICFWHFSIFAYVSMVTLIYCYGCRTLLS